MATDRKAEITRLKADLARVTAYWHDAEEQRTRDNIDRQTTIDVLLDECGARNVAMLLIAMAVRTLAHDLNSQLTGALGYCELALDTLSRERITPGHAGATLQHVTDALAMVKQMRQLIAGLQEQGRKASDADHH